MKRKLVLGLLIAVMVAVLIATISASLNYRARIIVAGGITKEVWVPENYEIITTWAEWEQKFPKNEALLHIPFDLHKKAVDKDNVCYVLVRPDSNIIRYGSYYGKVQVDSCTEFSCWPIDNYIVEYIGNGKIHCIVENNASGTIDDICLGLLVGAAIDLCLFILFGLLLQLIKKRREKPPSTPVLNPASQGST